MGSKAIRITCPKCHSKQAAEIWFRGNHGEQELLETHCNSCGWAIDGEGNLRNEGNLNREIPLFMEQKIELTGTERL